MRRGIVNSSYRFQHEIGASRPAEEDEVISSVEDACSSNAAETERLCLVRRFTSPGSKCSPRTGHRCVRYLQRGRCRFVDEPIDGGARESTRLDAIQNS